MKTRRLFFLILMGFFCLINPLYGQNNPIETDTLSKLNAYRERIKIALDSNTSATKPKKSDKADDEESYQVFAKKILKRLDQLENDLKKKSKKQPGKVLKAEVIKKSLFDVLPSQTIAKFKFNVGPMVPTEGTGEQDVPVTGTILNRFVTPNNISLHVGLRCSFGGNATGNSAVDRAIIYITEISCVKDDGYIWRFPRLEDMSEGNYIGWVAGDKDLKGNPDNYYGVAGLPVSRKGNLILARAILQSLGDYAFYMAEAETSEELAADQSGNVSTLKNVTGNKNKYLIGKSLGQTVLPQLNEILSDLIRKSLTYLYIQAGTSAYIVFNTEIDISGLLKKVSVTDLPFEYDAL